MSTPVVGIVMGSDSDLPVMQETAKVLEEYGVGCELVIASAHRAPEKAAQYARSARDRGLKVVIGAAGYSAHLAGVLASLTTLPVIGVPLAGSPLQGFDALLAMGQMPSGIPVATMTVGAAGAKNAAHFALQILATNDADLAARLATYRENLAATIEKKDQALRA